MIPLMGVTMFERIPKIFSTSFLFFRENPQILYTVFLLIVIPAAFLVSGQTFLNTAKHNQERLEKERIGLLQDTFAAVARESGHMSASDPFFQRLIEDIHAQNSSFETFKVVLRENGVNTVIASVNPGEIGKSDTENETLYQTAGLRTDQSFIFENYEDGVRHWKAVRALLDSSSEIKGFLFLDASMASIDELAMRNIQHAYLILFGIVLVIVILLLRQAKIVDYAVLYRKLKEVDEMKDDFVSMAAHELKAPLTVIKGYVSVLKESPLSPDDRESISRIDTSITGLNNLVSDILDSVRISQGHIEFSYELIDPSRMIASVVEFFTPMAREKGLVLTYEAKELPQINVDPKHFEQILTNLIGNAVKYTKQGQVSVTSYAELVAGGSEVLRIRISDTGVGISAEDQKKLFKRFSRIRTRETADIGGTGLGLWIVHEIVTAMKGTVTVESIKGKGSDFIVSFPVAPSQQVR
jgi:signal transduction histidine kinase